MFYRRKYYVVKPEFVENFNDHFNNTNLPTQLKYGSRLIGRWMTTRKDNNVEIFAIWEYDTYEEYIKIEEKVRSDQDHVRRVMNWYDKHGGRVELKNYILEVKNERLETTIGGENLKNSLLMNTDTSYDLNFLIYIQNIYLNQNRMEDKLRFPYFSSKFAFSKDFESNFKELWNVAVQKISDHHIFFNQEKDLFYQSLFVSHADSLKDYSGIHKTFEVWWGSMAGRFSVERSIDEISDKLYLELAHSLSQKGIEPEKELKISLIYDECLLANTEVTSYLAIIPIKDFFIKYKELVSKLEKCIIG